MRSAQSKRHVITEARPSGTPGCNMSHGVDRHLRCIQQILIQMPALTLIELKVTLPPHELVGNCYDELIRHLGSYTSIEKVKSIQFFTCEKMLAFDLSYARGPWQNLARWHRAEGIVCKVSGPVMETDIHDLYWEKDMDVDEKWFVVQKARMAVRKPSREFSLR